MVGGRYLLADLVGQGGLGRVWRGRDQLLDRAVAVKEVLLPPHLPPAEQAELAARAMREAKAAARLTHHNVITIHDVVDHGGAPWIVMELINGQSLAAEIRQHGRLPWQQAAEIGGTIAEALEHAHAHGIIHRDLKPSNILLPARRVVVIDFGIAHVLDATTKLTASGTLLGTPHYMAPEQIEGDAGAPADMWALGTTLYQATEGRLPFDGATLTAVLAGILTRDPPPPCHAGPLAGLLATLLSKDPATRPTPQAVADALAEATRRSRHAARQAEATAKAEALAVKGKSFRGQGLHADAEAAYREAIRLDPGFAAAHDGLGYVLWEVKRFGEAEAALREAIRLDPGNAAAHHDLGNVLRDLDRFGEAEGAYREAIRLDPGNAYAHHGLGDVLWEVKRFGEAEGAYREATRLDPGYAGAHHGLGNVLAKVRRFAEAEAAFRKAIRLNPGSARTHHGLGNVLSEGNRFAEAEAAYREAIRLNPGYAHAHHGLGNVLWGTGRLGEAEAAYREAIRLEPGYISARDNLKELLRVRNKAR